MYGKKYREMDATVALQLWMANPNQPFPELYMKICHEDFTITEIAQMCFAKEVLCIKEVEDGCL